MDLDVFYGRKKNKNMKYHKITSDWEKENNIMHGKCVDCKSWDYDESDWKDCVMRIPVGTCKQFLERTGKNIETVGFWYCHNWEKKTM
jgi:hypothetical protein